MPWFRVTKIYDVEACDHMEAMVEVADVEPTVIVEPVEDEDEDEADEDYDE